MPFSNTTEEHILSKTNYKVFMIPYEKELTEYFSSKDSVILAYLSLSLTEIAMPF